MTGIKTKWRVWRLPVGPEDTSEKRCVFHGTKEDTLEYYEHLRQSGESFGITVTNEHGDPVYACS